MKNMSTKKKDIILIVLLTLVITSGWELYHYSKYKIFNDFKHTIQKQHSIVNNIDFEYNGITCRITVRVSDRGSDFNLIEPIFLDILQEVNKNPVSDFLKRNPKLKSGGWINLSIVFYNSKARKTFYRFYSSESYEDWFKEGNEKNQIWKVENPSKEYRYSDYMK